MEKRNPSTYFVIQSAFMMGQKQGLADIKDIRRMMERSSRFISLSGWSGIAAGICALGGAWLASYFIHLYQESPENRGQVLEFQLLATALGTFVAAFLLAFLFTWFRSQKDGVPLWGSTALRLMFNTAIPLAAGGLVGYRLLELGEFGMIAPCCLIFYGLALVNGSKYTLGEVRYLGYLMLLLGFINLWMPGHGLLFWSLGFGLLHIIYGALMWWRHERPSRPDEQ